MEWTLENVAGLFLTSKRYLKSYFVDHTILLGNIYRLDVRGTLLELFESDLPNRKLCVQID